MYGNIQARTELEAGDLRRILHYCAVDSGAAITVRDHVRSGLSVPEFNLSVTPDELVERHQVWCLACRLACFCPQARVSVLIQNDCREAS